MPELLRWYRSSLRPSSRPFCCAGDCHGRCPVGRLVCSCSKQASGHDEMGSLEWTGDLPGPERQRPYCTSRAQVDRYFVQTCRVRRCVVHIWQRVCRKKTHLVSYVRTVISRMYVSQPLSLLASPGENVTQSGTAVRNLPLTSAPAADHRSPVAMGPLGAWWKTRPGEAGG